MVRLEFYIFKLLSILVCAGVQESTQSQTISPDDSYTLKSLKA